jgi:hypothetical protein
MGIPLNVTPKCLREVVMGTDFPLKEKSRISGKLRLEKILISVLSGLNDISHYWTIYPFHSNHEQ